MVMKGGLAITVGVNGLLADVSASRSYPPTLAMPEGEVLVI